MNDYKDRKLTKDEKIGVTAALLMFFGIGMLMGGSFAGNMSLFWSGVGLFAGGSFIALYLLFKHKKPEDNKDF